MLLIRGALNRKYLRPHEHCNRGFESHSRHGCMCVCFFYLVFEAIGTAATPGLLCQPRAIAKMIVEKQIKCRLAGETEVLGEKPAPAPLLSITKSHTTRPGFEPGPPRWKAVSAKLVPTFRVECIAWSAQRIPTVVNLGFIDRRCYFFIQVALQLSSRG
jgi:hypothetical protein